MFNETFAILERLNRYILSIDTHDDGQWKLQHRRQTIDPSFPMQG